MMKLLDVVGQFEVCAESRKAFVESCRLLMLVDEGDEYDLSLQLALRKIGDGVKERNCAVDAMSESKRKCHLCRGTMGSTNFCFRCGGVAPLPSFEKRREEKKEEVDISEFSERSRDRRTFSEFSGDLIFLARNLCHSGVLFGDDKVATAASIRLSELMAQYEPKIDGVEDVLNAVEALHVFDQFQAEPFDIPLPSRIKAKILVEEEKTTETLKRRRGWTREWLRNSIRDRLRCFGVVETLGFDPTRRQIPLVDWGHCSNCGREQQQPQKKRATTKCVECGVPLEDRIDFAALTDALVWTYLFRQVGISSCVFSDSLASFDDVLSVLPKARQSYQDREGSGGDDFFRLECYFVTHLIYVFSDWGKHMLRSDLFHYELNFISKNLKYVLDDVEIVGEFLHCLAILGCGGATLVPRQAIDLLKKETSSKNNNKTDYDRYHTAYCAAVGLVSWCGGASTSTDVVTAVPRVFRDY